MKIQFRKSALALALCGMISMQNAYADFPAAGGGGGAGGNASSILAAIKTNTDSILTGINNIPIYINSYVQTYIVPITNMATSWLTQDSKPSGIIPTNQASFNALYAKYQANLQSQMTMSQAATMQFMTNSLTATPNPPPININQLELAILYGTKIDQTKDKDTSVATLAQNYIFNISGANFYVPPPPAPTSASAPATPYLNYYNTIVAIESFDSFILSGLYTQQDKGGLHDKLNKQATSPDWFLKVATQDLGLVFRHLLMYVSQIYVQFDQMIKNQHDQLALQAMTNTLLILQNSQTTGTILYRQSTPGGGTQ